MPLVFQVNHEYAQIGELVPGLYICGVSALKKETMKAFRIGLIINATNEVPNFRFLGDDVQRLKLWIDDTVDEQGLSPAFLDNLSDQIHAEIKQGTHVLVHCVAGVSRSATVCLAYLTKYYCRSLRDAYHLMDSKRALVRPNITFWRQLIAFEQNVKGRASSVRLIRDEVQDGKLIPDVYLREVIPERTPSPERADCQDEGIRERQNSGSRTPKFHPVLEPLAELTEIAAA